MMTEKYAPKQAVKNLVLSAMFIAMGIVLPFLTGQIEQIGNLLQPIHIPVFLCGLICGWQYGLGVGLILPLLRSFLFTMPPLYPNAISIAVELAVYGLVAGFLYQHIRKQNIATIYLSMLPAMLLGRIAWGLAQMVLLGLNHNVFTWQMFVAGAFVNAVPGIILQLVLVPAILSALNRTGLLPYKSKANGRKSLCKV